MRPNRRKFIRNSALLAGGIIAAPHLLRAKGRMAGDTVRLGVIGTGSRGKGLINIANQIEGLKVTACADIIPFRLEEGVNAAPGSKGYSTHEALLEKGDVDAVVIATPFSTHGQIAIDSIDAGKHVYCEKTMVMGIKETQDVIDKAKGTGLVFQTGHQYHSSPLYQKALQIIRSGYIGEVTAYECQWNRNGDWRRPVPDPKWERLINWRMYREYSGGLIAELMSHQIDFINWVTESHPAKIIGFGGIDHWIDGRETFDNAHLLFEYPDGLDASFKCTTTNGFEDYQIKVLGKKGTIILDYTTGEIFSEDQGIKEKGIVDGVSGATMKAWEEGKGAKIDAPGNDPTFNAFEQFYDGIVNDIEVPSDIKTGALTSKCVHIGLEALHDEKVKYWEDYPELRFT